MAGNALTILYAVQRMLVTDYMDEILRTFYLNPQPAINFLLTNDFPPITFSCYERITILVNYEVSLCVSRLSGPLALSKFHFRRLWDSHMVLLTS